MASGWKTESFEHAFGSGERSTHILISKGLLPCGVDVSGNSES